MVSVANVEVINKALDRGNNELDKEVVQKFFTWARMATAFFQEHGMPPEILSSDKEGMDFFLWAHHDQLVGCDISHGKEEKPYDAFGLYKGGPIEIFPDKLVIRTYVPQVDGFGTYLYDPKQGKFLPDGRPLIIPSEDISKFLGGVQAELRLGDLSVEAGLCATVGPDNAQDLLREFGKSTKIIPKEDIAYRWLCYG